MRTRAVCYASISYHTIPYHMNLHDMQLHFVLLSAAWSYSPRLNFRKERADPSHTPTLVPELCPPLSHNNGSRVGPLIRPPFNAQASSGGIATHWWNHPSFAAMPRTCTAWFMEVSSHSSKFRKVLLRERKQIESPVVHCSVCRLRYNEMFTVCSTNWK
jgi:hypothetical protein